MIGESYPVLQCATLTEVYTQGPAIGPIMGGFIAESVGVLYVFYVIAAISGVAAIIGIPLMRETYAPVIRLRLNDMALDPEKIAVGRPVLTAPHMDKWAYLWVNLKRPAILLARSFICFILSLYMAL
jgi:MFS family permease